MDAALARDREARERCRNALASGDREEAVRLAALSYTQACAAHECARQLGYPRLSQFPRTIAKESYERLLEDPNMQTEKRANLLDLIVISPDCPQYAILAAENILDGAFPAAEASIATSAEYSYEYSLVIGGRFELGEGSIQGSKEGLWSIYCFTHSIDPWQIPTFNVNPDDDNDCIPDAVWDWMEWTL